MKQAAILGPRRAGLRDVAVPEPEGDRMVVAAAATRRRSGVALVGESRADLSLRAGPDLIRKGLTAKCSRHDNLNDVPKVLQVIRRAPGVAQLMAHRFQLSALTQAFEAAVARASGRASLTPGPERLPCSCP